MAHVRTYLLAGLAVLLPIGVTWWLLVKIFRFADGLMGNYLYELLGYRVPGIGLLCTVLVILLTGFIATHLATHILGRRLFEAMERFFSRIPLVKQIYYPAKQMTHMLVGQNRSAKAFSRAVLVPISGLHVIGFVTNESLPELDKYMGETMISVLIPTTPTPVSGYFAYVPREQVIPLNISFEEAVKLVISSGVVSPDSAMFPPSKT